MSEVESDHFLGIVDSGLNTADLIPKAYALFQLQSYPSIFILVSEKKKVASIALYYLFPSRMVYLPDKSIIINTC